MNAKQGLEVDTDAAICCAPLTSAPIDAVQATELAKVLSALADPVRLQRVSLVAANGEVCSCDLEVPLGKRQPTISHHTTVLVEAGLLRGRKDGRWTWWSLVPGRLAQVRDALGG
ncbi:MAG: metalloregulator ArsR/SmtB family transcription factor [Acidimicrobiales bacterium]